MKVINLGKTVALLVLMAAGSVTCAAPTLAPGPALAPEVEFEWKDRYGRKAPDTDNRKCKNNFAAQLFLTKNKNLWKEWSTLPENKPPSITTITEPAKRNEPIFMVLIFANPKLDDEHSANVTCDLSITKPDGKISHPPATTGWKGRYLTPATNLQIGYPSISVTFDETDPNGKYEVNATVRDNNRKVELKLQTSFEID